MQESQTMLQRHSLRSVDVTCRKCRSKDVVVSRQKGIERFIVSVLPVNICRCIDCYHRFWVVESFFANTKRIWIWFCLFFVVAAAVLLMLKSTEQNVSLSRTSELIPQFDQNEVGQTEVIPSASTKLALNEVLSNADTDKVSHEDDILEVAASQNGNLEKLSDAKLQSEVRSVAQKESLARLEQAVIADKGALESLLKVDMSYRVERWRDAWQSGLSDYYLEFYSEAFQPNNGLPLSEWIEQRKSRINPAKEINIELKNFDVSFSDDMKKTIIVFDQLYSSETFSENSRKQLVWVNESGEWKIISEIEIK